MVITAYISRPVNARECSSALACIHSLSRCAPCVYLPDRVQSGCINIKWSQVQASHCARSSVVTLVADLIALGAAGEASSRHDA